jgi:O-antigen ligase
MYRLSPASSVEFARKRGRRRGAAMVVPCGLLLLSVLLGRAVVETQTLEASAPKLALSALGVMVATAVMLAGPVACIAAIAGLTALPLLPNVELAGGVDLFPADAFFAALVGWWLIRMVRARTERSDAELRTPLRAGVVVLFLGYVGLTLLHVAAVDPGRLPVSSVSWLRLVETASIGWLAAMFVRTRRDLTVVLAALALAGGVAVLLAVAGATATPDAGPLGVRGGGIINPNTLGLVSGLLVLMGTYGVFGRSLLQRIPLALCGAAGLVQSQSVGSLVATGVALMLGLAFMTEPRWRLVAARAPRVAIALGIGVALAYGAATVIRPENLPTSQQFDESSAGQRRVLAAAGIEIVERNPVIGVGWRRSEVPEVIGDPDLNAELRARFRATKSEFFPDVSPGSVHNGYVQVAADAGLIGLGLLVLVFVSLGRQIAGILRRVTRRSPEWPQLWFLAWAVVLIVVWWNDNPIYGGQIETVAPAIFVGAIAGLSRALMASAPRPGPPRRHPPRVRLPRT